MFIAISLALQAAPSFNFTAFGGERSCAASFRPEIEPLSREWAAGYWSGRNLGEGRMVGQHTDFDGIMGEIRLLCAERPSMSLLAATNEIYNRMRGPSRP